MTIEEIKTYLDENKEKEEVAALLNSYKLTNEDLLKQPEFVKLFDQRVSNSIATFKEKTLPGLVEVEKKKLQAELNPTLSLEMVKIQELEKRLQEKERAELIGNQKNKVLKSFSDKGLPTDLADYLIAESDEETDKRIEAYTQLMTKYEQKIREDVLKGHSTNVPKEKMSETLSGEPGPNATQAEWAAYTKAQLRHKK